MSKNVLGWIWRWLFCLTLSAGVLSVYFFIVWSTPPMHLDPRNAAGALTDYQVRMSRGSPAAIYVFAWLCLLVGLMRARGAILRLYFMNVAGWTTGVFLVNIIIVVVGWLVCNFVYAEQAG